MIGEQVGSYLVESELGRGGMGAVYRARHVMLKRAAAIKVLLPQYSSNPQIVQRFFNEAKAATSIQHMGIVEVYDFGMLENGTAYIAMELLRGESLADRMDKPTMPLHASLAILRQICGALGAAHALGIVHRDLKPDNIYLVPDPELPSGERIKLLDFGIAKLTQEATGEGIHKTQTGSLMGTPTYMAPEQCRGIPLDLRADLYSLGCILYEMIAGRPPFVAEAAGDLLVAHICDAPKPVSAYSPTTPADVVTLVQRLLEKAPRDRPQTTAEIIEIIDSIQLGRGVPAPRIDPRSLGDAPTLMSAPAVSSSEPASGMSTTLSGTAASMTAPQPEKKRRGTLIAGGLATAAVAAVATFVVAPFNSHRTPASAPAVVASPAPVPAEETTPSPSAPMPGSAAPQPSTITINLDTRPSGASVVIAGKVVGTTPYVGAFPRQPGSIDLTLTRSGYVERLVRLDSDHDDTRMETLEPVKAASVRRDRAKSVTHTTTVSPSPTSTTPTTATPTVAKPAVPAEDDDAPVNPLRGKLRTP